MKIVNYEGRKEKRECGKCFSKHGYYTSSINEL